MAKDKDLYTYSQRASDIEIYKDGHKMFAQDIAKDLNNYLSVAREQSEAVQSLQSQLAESEKLRIESIEAWSDMLDKAQAKIDKLEKQKAAN